MLGLSTIVFGRRPWFVLALWLAAMLVAVALELPARFAAGQDSDRTTFLPSSAESTRAIERERASGDERTPLVIVYQRDGGLTAADVAGATADVARLQAAERARPAIYRGLVTAADWRPTLRGEGFMLRADVRTPPEAEALNALVADIRATVHRGGRDGLRVAVTGPAAAVADAERVFEQVDVRLYAGALALVMLLLVLVYRSPVFLWLPLAAVGAAELMTRALGWVLVEAGVPVTDQASAIVSVLVLGVGTDYALLIVARYREHLRDESDHRAALAGAIRAAAPAVVASGAVVIVALLCLVLADVPSTRGLGPIAALGVAVSVVAMLTLLPALLALAGRRALVASSARRSPGARGLRARAHGSGSANGSPAGRGPYGWCRAPRWPPCAPAGCRWTRGSRRCRPSALRSSPSRASGSSPRSSGRALRRPRRFPCRRRAPTPSARSSWRCATCRASTTVVPGDSYGGVQTLQVLLERDPYSREAYALVPRLRAAAKAAGGPDVLVGGATAIEADLREAAARDNRRIVPLTLFAVLLVLVVLLRALVAPLVLVASVLLSYGAAVGFGSWLFVDVLGYGGVDPALPLFAFVFLVAIGVDYNIFLMSRVREEARTRTTSDAMVQGLAATGGVITAAGAVLAGTFAMLAVFPLVSLTEIGVVIAAGIVLDTVVVRTLLVPAVVCDLGRAHVVAHARLRILTRPWRCQADDRPRGAALGGKTCSRRRCRRSPPTGTGARRSARSRSSAVSPNPGCCTTSRPRPRC